MMSMTLYDDSTLDTQMACHWDSPPSSCHQPCDSKVNQVKRAMGSYKGSQVFLGSVLWTQEARTQLLNWWELMRFLVGIWAKKTWDPGASFEDIPLIYLVFSRQNCGFSWVKTSRIQPVFQGVSLDILWERNWRCAAPRSCMWRRFDFWHGSSWASLFATVTFWGGDLFEHEK